MEKKTVKKEKKVEEFFNVGTKVKGPMEADPRDFQAAEVLPLPSKEEIAALPESASQGMYVGHTYYQNGWGSCVSLGTTHSMLIQNVKELQVAKPDLLSKIVAALKAGKNIIELQWESLWTKMGHILGDKSDSGDYVENGLKTTINKGIDGVDENGNPKVYFGKNFAVQNMGTTDYDMNLVKYYLTKYPIIDVIGGTQNTWSEMMKGEIKTILPRTQVNGFHCICRVGYDKDMIYFLNSWSPNDKTKKKCVFGITRANYKKMIEVNMINWRYRVLFDKAEAVVDLEKLKEDNTATLILQTLHDNVLKLKSASAKKVIMEAGAVLRVEYPVANKSVPL